jgi:hypothetical protein
MPGAVGAATNPMAAATPGRTPSVVVWVIDNVTAGPRDGTVM